MSVVPNERIVKTPETFGGRALIADHRVRVQDIVILYEHHGMTPDEWDDSWWMGWLLMNGMTPDEIVGRIPTITLADVHSALAYYFDHAPEIQKEIQADREYADGFFRQNPSLLDARIKQERLKEASWPVHVSFHLDEHIPTALTDALRSRGIDVTTMSDAGLAGTADLEHLEFAAKAGRVVVTQDVDFLRLHAARTTPSGIAFWRQQTRTVGEVLRRLVPIHAIRM